MDRRQQKTRQAVFRAFTNLLERKSYSNISVQEIIDGANIGRSTFYAHFETKDDLLKSLCEEIFHHVFSDNLKKETTHDFSACHDDIKSEITHILYHIQGSKKYIKSILSCESGYIFMEYFKEYLCKVFDNKLRMQELKIPFEYILNHIVCDFTETVRWWMKNEKYSPEDISSFFFNTNPLAFNKEFQF